MKTPREVRIFTEPSLNGPSSMPLILDHVLTTTYNNRPHLTTFFGDCFDGFNKSGNQLGLKSLIASNKHTTIPTCHQHLSSRPRHKPTNCKSISWLYSIMLFVLSVTFRQRIKQIPVNCRIKNRPTVESVLHRSNCPENAFARPCGTSARLHP